MFGHSPAAFSPKAAKGYRRFNSEVVPGCALVCGTDQGCLGVPG